MTGPRGPRRLIPLCRAGDRLSRAARSAVHFTLDRRSQAWPSRPQAAFPRAPAARNARIGRTCAALARGVKIAGPRRGKAAGRRARPGLAAGRREGRAPATPGGPSAGRAAPAQAEPQAGQRGAAGRSQARPGRRRGRPHSPHFVGAGPRRSTCAATGAGEEQCKAGPTVRPAGAWPCIAEGCPRATAGGQLGRDAPQARPWPPHVPDCDSRRGGRRHAAAQGGQGDGPQAVRGGWDAAHRRGRGREPLCRRRRQISPCLTCSFPQPGPCCPGDGGHGARAPA